jgi:enamine deaminase RidA (YjgF/YER057c/UK114 family)
MPKTLLNPASLAKPSGYTNGILTQGGRLLFLAGQTGLDASGTIVSTVPNITPQFHQALSNLQAVVTEAGGQMTDIVKLTIYVTHKAVYQENLKELGAIHKSFFGKYYPAMALVEVKSLWNAEAMVEVEGIAVIE